ncbi:MAG: UbiD family decarboxylase [Gammaproteobacteria bacterium]|nr:UbiD family decarboxylase [Gammaproteobacteria bacterium]
MTDLRSFLGEHSAAVWELTESADLRHELTALQHVLDLERRYPVVLARRVKNLRGEPSSIPVVLNLTASRELTARALGIPDHRQTAQWFASRTRASIAPQVVARDSAPVQQVVLQGEAASLFDLPVLTQHELEPGPYLTSAHATTYDPDTGIDNTAIQRCWVKGPRSMTWFPYPATHNARNLRKFHARGEPAPIAFWIGHHPAVLLGTQAKLKYPESHWAAAGGVLGAPLRLVPSVMHGERIMVPADAEIVIEGFVPPGQLTDDGPFGEYTGYLGGQVKAPLVDIGCITRRRDALYHDYGSGLTDMLVPDNMAMEGKLFELVKSVAPSIVNVHVPTEGRRFHAYLQLRDPGPGEARDALTAALAYRRVKTVLAVDTDIDIFDSEAILWALATRVRWDRDAISVPGLSGSSLDPSLPDGVSTVTKLGIDATVPASARGSGKEAYAKVSTVPAAAMQRAREWLGGAAGVTWPKF